MSVVFGRERRSVAFVVAVIVFPENTAAAAVFAITLSSVSANAALVPAEAAAGEPEDLGEFVGTLGAVVGHRCETHTHYGTRVHKST